MAGLPLRFVVGLIAGLIAWVIWEPSYPKSTAVQSQVELYMVLTAGALIGAAVAGLNGFLQGGKKHTTQGILIGGFLGMVGISAGYGVGSALTTAIFGPGWIAAPIPVVNLARMLAITPPAALLGLAVGAATLSGKRATQGLIGGALAGAVAGFLFDIVGAALATPTLVLAGQTSGDTGGTSRALYFGMIGSLIALFIGLVDRLARKAWLRQNLGRNEGREWSLDWAQNFIGRSEQAQVPLFGDGNVAPIHACIQKSGGRYVLYDNNSPTGTYVNGHRIQSVELQPGMTIQIGSYALQFLTKNAPHAAAMPVQSVPVQPMPVPPGPSQPAAAYPQPGPNPLGPAGISAPTVMQPSSMPPGPNPASIHNPTVMMGQAAPIPQAMAAGPSLMVLDGPGAGTRVTLTVPVDLGREASPQWMAHDHHASRRHARVSLGPTGPTVQDLGSSNGTLVNGNRVMAADLRPGDIVTVGSTRFRLES